MGPASLSSPRRFNHTEQPESFDTWFPLQLTHFRLLCGHFVSFPRSLHSCLWCSAETCSVLVQCSVMYAPRFAAAAARRVCEFVAVEASVDSSPFDVAPGKAVVASEEYAIGFVVSCVCHVTEGDHYGPWSTLSRVLRAM